MAVVTNLAALRSALAASVAAASIPLTTGRRPNEMGGGYGEIHRECRSNLLGRLPVRPLQGAP